MRANKNTIAVLCDLLHWAKGNRGSKAGNPYAVPEVKAALKHLAELQGITSYFDAETDLNKLRKERKR